MTPDSVIRELGGTAEVARALRVKAARVSNWRGRNKIPSDFWAELVDLAAALGKNGITSEALAAMHARSAAEEAHP